MGVAMAAVIVLALVAFWLGVMAGVIITQRRHIAWLRSCVTSIDDPVRRAAIMSGVAVFKEVERGR